MSQRTDAARGARLAGLARRVLALFARRGRGCGGGGRVQVVARGGRVQVVARGGFVLAVAARRRM